ncbi:uncharacterized protein si:busm1-163l24.3 [Thunnus maccoyii]|uniref:uncharacterized protein si:busm1-163l24.3 n=1 Tax=Thunnus maccoyii TaxID=8240 RepID=UPI001C4BB6D5|nr:uncharacterized protein si:busm1-163l24.3 [Thunnus maccoyii]XP_042248720.1 uncharacterized protein si:busm1-163l24.3 [Thunnus maccoyii]
MAELGRTVRVSGLPTDIEDDRLRDKLCIYFLRNKNGGGEIESVTIVEASPNSALITFEDSEVAQRVIQHSWHILEVDKKKYELIVTEHQERLDPDKVILSLSATVDYSQLPGGKIALTGLHKSHPDVQITYDTIRKLCTLGGAYCKVQAALAELLGQPGGSQSAEHKDSAQPATSRPKSANTVQKPHTLESDDYSRKPNKQREQREKVNIARPSDKCTSSSHRDLTPDGYDWDDTGQLVCGALQLPGLPTMSESEDLSLILDADMFQYLQKRCRKEYQHILSQYGVEVVDMTNQGLTTLYLQVAIGVGEDGQEKERMKLARRAISKLYHENETKIRRSQLPKNILSPGGSLQKVIDKLSVRLPKLLLNEDDRNVYIIGSSSDVSEAKQFLLLDHSHDERGKKEDVASLLNFPSYASGSSTPAVEERASSSSAGSLDVRIDQTLQSEEDERRDEGARRYKLAARFKDSGLSALGSRPGDFTVRGLSSPSRQTRPGPMLGHDVLSETAGIAGERVSRAAAQNTGGDILFKSGDALHSSVSMQSKTSLNSHLMNTPPRSTTAPLSTTQPSLSGSTTLPPAGYGSTLKRASSFSGMPENKAESKGQKYQDDPGKSSVRVRGRSSSFSNQKGRDKREVYRAELTVSAVMWYHIKEAYSMRVDDLTSDVQIKESSSQSSRDLTVFVRGADSSKVSSCQLGLQKLVDSVTADFSMQEISLSELGVADPEDETLQACCTEVRSRFKKVTIQILKNSLFLLGPNQLCSQVGASLREVFSGDLAQIPEQQDLSSLSTSNWNPSTYLMNEDQSTSLHCHSNPQFMLESQTGKELVGTSRSQERRTNHRGDTYETELPNGSFSQPLVRKDPVIKEKVKMAGTVELDGQRTETFANLMTKGNDGSARRVNGVGSTSTRTDKDTALHKKETTIQAEIQETPEESRLGQGGLGSLCVCGERGMSMTRTECGATMCCKCLDTVHVHCRVCVEKEPTPRGIQGEMSYSKLNISVPGHNKVSAIKITYCIPDGIQGEGHPSPGKPFQGAVHEAFLPDCEKTMKLLPRLEKAFRQGLTFTVTGKETEARVTWDCIPHKTSLQGGKSGNGYPDSTYLKRLSEVLASLGIDEPPAKSQG